VISSNSSFSWWAAWLNRDARVIAPRLWLGLSVGEEFPPGTIPAGWEQIAGSDKGDGEWSVTVTYESSASWQSPLAPHSR
jgi:hypothetical protein